jgi:hypothetical protein
MVCREGLDQGIAASGWGAILMAMLRRALVTSIWAYTHRATAQSGRCGCERAA